MLCQNDILYINKERNFSNMKNKTIKNPRIEEAFKKDNFQYIHVKAEINRRSINMFIKIYITDETKKIYIDKIKSLNLELLQELYDTRNSFTGHSRIVISQSEYNSR